MRFWHAGESVDLVVSRASRLTLLDETGHLLPGRPLAGATCGSGWRGAPTGSPAPLTCDIDDVRHWSAGDLAAGPSSGSYPAKGMLIVPASTACVAGVALGLSKDLLQRAASVTLKEGRKLVVAVRETPLNGQTLRHLVSLDDAGATVLPASPAFYAGATHIQDLVDFVAGRVLDAAGVGHGLYRRWEGELGGGFAHHLSTAISSYREHLSSTQLRALTTSGTLQRKAIDRMDAVDRQLIQALRENGRASYAELGRLVGLSGPSVTDRINRLEAAGVITGYRATVDSASLGLGVIALIGISLSDAADHEDVAHRLQDLSEIEDCWFIAGDDSFMLKVRASDVDGLEKTIRRLSGTKGVSRTRTTIVLSTKWENRVG